MNVGKLNLTKVFILFVRKSAVSLISGAYLLHNKKINVHIIDSNSESAEEMSNTSPEVANDNCNNCKLCKIVLLVS
jgi:hypothetical protein